MKVTKASCANPMGRLFILSTALAVMGAVAAQACVGNTAVRKIYPTGDVLPENILRMYIYFTAPMTPGDAVKHISLRDMSGDEIPDVFLPTRFALWSPDRKRLTVIFDPGRVKTGLEANVARGRALTAGNSYEIQVEPTVRDANGCNLVEAHTKQFKASEEDLDPPIPGLWTLNTPRSGTREPLHISMNGPQDHLSLAFGLRVRNHAGDIVSGRINAAEAESEWLFTPAAPWGNGNYILFVDKKFEDLAGNRPTGLFDDPTGQSRLSAAAANEVKLAFKPR